MADKESTVLLRYTTDQASLRQTEQSSKKLFASLTTPKTVQSLKSTNKEVDNLRVRFREAEAAAKDVARATKSIEFQERFDEVSRQVALAGDVQSNLGALSGLAGAAGAGRLGQGLGIAGELVVLTEELPRLKTAMQGLPSAIGSAASALGPLGLVALPVAAAGAFGLSKALEELSRRSQEAKDRTEAGIDIQRRYFDVIANGTKEDVQAAISNLEQQNEVLIQLRNSIGADIQRLAELSPAGLAVDAGTAFATLGNELERLGDVSSLSKEELAQLFTEILGVPIENARQTVTELEAVYGEGALSTDILKDTFKALGGETENNTRLISHLNDALARNATAANDAAAAEEKRVEALRQSADAERQRVLLESQFMGMSSDALNQRVQQLRNEITANQAAADVLRQGGQDASQYEQAIADLNRQIDFIKTTATPAARAVEALAKAEERRTKAAEEAKRIQEDIKNLDTQAREQSQKIAEDYAKRQVDLAKKQAQGELDAQKDLQRRLTDAQTDLARDQANAVLEAQRDTFQAQLDFQREEAEAARRHVDKLEDIQRQAQRDERRNILDRNFKAIFEQRIQTRERIQDEQRGFSRERREAIQSFKEQADDRSRAFADERADRLLQYEQARSDIHLNHQRRLSDLRENLMQERLELQAAYVEQLNDLKAFLAAETMAKKLALQQQFSLAKGSPKTVPLSKGNNQPLPKVSNVNQQSNQQNVNITINESGNPQKTLKTVKQAMTA